MVEDLPRQKLCEIIARYGQVLCDDPRRCRGLLLDYCGGGHKREIRVLVDALGERVALDLLTASDSLPPDVLVARLTRRLQDNLGLTRSLSRWAAETWAIALGKLPPPKAEVSHHTNPEKSALRL